MKKILFITSRNIMSTCGELRLIKNRGEVLKNQYGYSSDYIVYRLRKKNQNENIDGKLIVYQAPFDRIKLLSTTKNMILSDEYKCVILSGGTIFLARYIKNINQKCKVIIDIHGTVEEYVEFRNKTLIEKRVFRILYKYTKRMERKNLPHIDGILAVSHPLADQYYNLADKKEMRMFVVPCAVSESISYEEYNKNRIMFREKYHLRNDDIVFVYSGGDSPWQCVYESIDLFKKIRGKIGTRCKMLLFSGSRELLNAFKAEAGIITDSLAPDEVAATLCVGDFGIMLRGDFKTNNVAFPNKFLEYVSSGLRVIATPYVYDVRDYIKEYNIGYIVNFPIDTTDVDRMCGVICSAYDMNEHFKRRDALINKCSFYETLKPFCEYIGESK